MMNKKEKLDQHHIKISKGKAEVNTYTHTDKTASLVPVLSFLSTFTRYSLVFVEAARTGNSLYCANTRDVDEDVSRSRDTWLNSLVSMI